MSYFKKRIKDSWQITKEMFSGVTWINSIIVVPGLLFMLFFVWFWMLFEDYEEIDKAKETVDHLFKSKQ